jgi:cyanophycinase
MNRVLLNLAVWLSAMLPLAVCADQVDKPAAGYVVPVGGALDYENGVVWSRLVALAGGEDAHFAVLAIASEDPEGSAQRTIAALRKYGAQAEFIGVAPLLKGSDSVREASSPEWVSKVHAASAVFFTGGAQERIVDTLLPGGKPTPLLEAIRDLHRRGGVIAGTSAGAAIMSEIMFRDAQDVLKVLRGSLRMGHEIDRGLGFLDPYMVVDQHFLRRGRIGRLLPLMQARRIRLGLGVDENTAAIVHQGMLEVVGASSVLVVDLAKAGNDAGTGAFNLHGARLSLLGNGDRMNLETLEVTPSAAKRSGTRIDPNADDYKPYHDAVMFYPDFLGDRTLVTAMGRLLDSPQRELRGLAFAPLETSGESRPEPGFEFRLAKTAQTLGWLSTAGGGEEYTIIQILLDVDPVRMADPLYRPWRKTSP